VVATDISARALGFARFNLALNGVRNVECREGDRFDPVADERFDLIVSNAPAVMSPEGGPVYRESGMEGDALSASVVSGAADHLAPGGWAHVTAHWLHVRGARWEDRVAAWVDGSGCDAWAIQHHVEETAAYAYKWIEGHDAAARLPRWMAYLRGLGVEAVGSGIVALRKAEGRPGWFRASSLDQPLQGQTAGAIEQGFLAAGRALDRVMVAPGVVLHRSYRCGPGGWAACGAVLEEVGGLRRRVDVDEATVEALARSGPLDAGVTDALVADGFVVPL
jgi:methylase of polypeptide subunit release factors